MSASANNLARDVIADKGEKVHIIEPNATVARAVEEMNRHRIGALVVCMEGHPVGMLTERDILTRVISERRDPATTWVSEVMTADIVFIEPTTAVPEAMGIMTRRRCRHLPVIDGASLVGLISIGDLTEWVLHEQELQIDDLVRYITVG
jgi:CBS domain-containing protein